MTMFRKQSAARMLLLYVLIGGFLVVISDDLMLLLAKGPRAFAHLETYKGWLFILITGAFLYVERRRAEHHFGRLIAVVESSDDAIIGLTPDGHITSLNRGAQEMFGDRQEQVRGRSVSSLFPEDTPLDLQRILQRTHAGESIRDEETAALRDNGEKFFASLTFAPVRNVRGNVTAVSLTIRDLTQRKRAEEQLHWAQVGKLASGLVHEVRNPLNAMRVQIAVARNRLKHVDGAANEAARSQLEHLEQEVLRVHNLASEFLAYGRPHPDKLEQIDLKKLISDVVEFIRPECEAESTVVRLECRTASPSPTIVMDQEKLRQALFNLTENARQAMPNGGELTITIDQPAAHEMRVRMYDTGHGIPANQLPRVFEAFYSTRDGGTGLGLAIVKRTIEAAGGRVDVQSEPGGGTCFDLYFPQACASTSQAGVTMVSG